MDIHSWCAHELAAVLFSNGSLQNFAFSPLEQYQHFNADAIVFFFLSKKKEKPIEMNIYLFNFFNSSFCLISDL